MDRNTMSEEEIETVVLERKSITEEMTEIFGNDLMGVSYSKDRIEIFLKNPPELSDIEKVKERFPKHKTSQVKMKRSRVIPGRLKK